MGVYNQLQVARYNRYLQKLLSMKGPASLEALNPELQAIIQMFHGVENRNLEGWDRFGIGVTVNAVAAVQSSIQFRNPKSSNVIVVFEKLTVTNGVAGVASLSRSTITADLTNINVPINIGFDTRSRPLPTTVISNVASGAGGDLNIIHSVSELQNVPYDYIWDEQQEIPLLPGDALRMSGPVNSTEVFGAFWRERFLEDSERS